MSEIEIFYITASVFLAVATVMICAAGFYLIRILRNFQRASSNLRDISTDLKEKIEGLSGIVAGMMILLQRVAKAYFQKKKRSEETKTQ